MNILSYFENDEKYLSQIADNNEFFEALAALDDWSEEETIHDLLLSLPKQLEMKNGQVLWPVRTAITGKQFTPGGAIEIAHILGKEETLKRIGRGIAKLEEAIKAE